MKNRERIYKIMSICKREDDLFYSYLSCLFRLKEYSQQFSKVKQEVRVDYLIRGICEREVDILVEQNKQVADLYIPKMLRWEFLRINVRYIEDVCSMVFQLKPLCFSEEQWKNVIKIIEKELP
ncbi:group-specific protein [Bacillus sp. CGMCC 1.60114]|uniref:group-specific protein n=1 Tax=unclassified Bacillus (in: firmicutes) TaxID=185979 RepID=UPI0036339AD7